MTAGPSTSDQIARQAMSAPMVPIIDPDYARVFTKARAIAWQEGYALMAHGSLTRDLDLLAVPWTEAASEPEHLMRRIADANDLKAASEEPGRKPHGRLAWTLLFPAFGDPRFVDLSIMPRFVATPDAGEAFRAGIRAGIDTAIDGISATVLVVGGDCDRRGIEDPETGEAPCEREEEGGCACSVALELGVRLIKNLRLADIDKVAAKAPPSPAQGQSQGGKR